MHRPHRWLLVAVALACCLLSLIPVSGADLTELSKLVGSGTGADREFGFCVAASGDDLFVGARNDLSGGIATGLIYAFPRSAGAWALSQTLVSADAAALDRFGGSVAADGSTLVVGAYADGDAGDWSGSAYFYELVGSKWSGEQKVTAADAAAWDQFGVSVSVSGDYAIVGALADDDGGLESGSAYVFFRTGSVWAQQAKLVASDGVAGDFFGTDVAIYGDYAVIGAPGDDSLAGSAYVFKRSGTTWTQQAKLVAADQTAGDEFASSVAIYGSLVVAGALSADSGAGAVYVFERTVATWSEVDRITPSGASANDAFGFDVAIYGQKIVVGAPTTDSIGEGATYLFDRGTSSWLELARFIASDAQTGDALGFSVAVGPTYAVAGAIEDDTQPGSAYVFDGRGLDCDGNGIPDVCDTSCAATNPVTQSVCSIDYPLPACGAKADCNGNGRPDSCDADCNANGSPDDCDITSGASTDCDTNGIPDECEIDCNANGVTDACDITSGDSEDCNSDGTPDECEIHQTTTPLSADFAAGVPFGWTADSLWHTTSACAATGSCNATAWAYFGQDGACTFNTGGAVSGTLAAPQVAIPASATSATLTYCSAYRGEGGIAPTGFDSAWVAANGTLVDDAGTIGLVAQWETRTVDLTSYAGQTVAITWNFDSIDGSRNNTLGWQVADVELLLGIGEENDCNTNGILDECDLASGVSQDCNVNSTPDSCDIAAGSSDDCNSNGTPDECESAADCNNNGIPDICDVEIVYVDASATGAADGSSWTDAYTDLQPALASAASACIDAEIWLAAGQYAPAPTSGDRFVTFQLADGVAIYGGFTGTETLRKQRNADPATNNTVLTGDLIGNDVPSGGRAENVYHVVTADGTTASARLDGVTIRGGNADGTHPHQLGSALSTVAGHPTIRNCRFTDNDARGGTAYISRSSPTLLDCTFVENRAENGGALYIATDSAPVIVNCAFIGNVGNSAGNGYGGAMYVSGNGDPLLVNCVFSGNTTDSVGGAMYLQSTGSVATIVNCTFSRNTSIGIGGGIAVLNNGTVDVRNSIFWGNTDAGGSDESAQLHIDPAAFATLAYSTVQNLTGALGGSGNIGTNPAFADDDGIDNIVGTADDDLSVTTGSPCIDAGSNGAYDVGAYGNVDLASLPRMLDDPDVVDTGAGTPPIIDMGAFERQTDCNSNGVPDATDIASGTSNDCTGNSVPDECELDCNTNGLADSCDIDTALSSDCDANGIPDECDLAGGASDCNLNGVLDGCDISGGTSTDCDTSGVPDTCKADCNSNGTPDVCEDFSPVSEISTQLSPISAATPQSYTLVSTKRAFTNVTIAFTALADLGSPDEYIAVDLNGTSIGDVFVTGTGDECPAISQDQIVLTPGVFNNAMGTGPAIITMTPTAFVANVCLPTSYIVVSVQYEPIGDCNANSVPDDCDIADGTETDSNLNGIPDTCEDCNTNGVADDLDIAATTSADLNGNGLPDECEDCNENAIPDSCDIDCGSVAGPCDLPGCGLVADANGNSVPDDCEDCNGNTILDTLDVSVGTSSDCNANDVPDECEIDSAGGAAGGPYYCTAACDPDCNVNGLIDACEISAGSAADCDVNAIPDVCDIAAGTATDCNTNGIGDTCSTETDGDGDGTIDDCDGCPSDGAKTAPGVCGCGIADDDADSDGVADCTDACPNTPSQTPVDATGCPFVGGCCLGLGNCLELADTTCLALQDGTYLGNGTTCLTDSDGDTFADCDESCPADPAKTAPGDCGCGVPDDDTDADGVADCLDLCPATPPGDAVDSNGCSLYGACCIIGVDCLDGSATITEVFCLSPLGGVYQGNGSVCASGCAYGVGGDFDGDGDVDCDDTLQLAGCVSGPWGASGFVAPAPQCRTVFDFDGDNDVDLFDYDRFQRASTGTPCGGP